MKKDFVVESIMKTRYKTVQLNKLCLTPQCLIGFIACILKSMLSMKREVHFMKIFSKKMTLNPLVNKISNFYLKISI